MTARAARAGSPGPGATARRVRALIAFVSLIPPTAAEAQVGARVSVYSDDRFRGVSLSDGRPVGILDASYDLSNGFYAALSGSAVATRDEGLRLLGYSANAGYALRLRPELSADLGIVHPWYSHYSGLSGRKSYTEVYAGLTGRTVGVRLSVSPDYLGVAHWTAYGEADGHLDLSRSTLIDGSVGVLIPIGGSYRSSGRPQADARLGIAHRLGPVTLHAAVTARSRTYLYSGRSHARASLVVGLSTAL